MTGEFQDWLFNNGLGATTSYDYCRRVARALGDEGMQRVANEKDLNEILRVIDLYVTEGTDDYNNNKETRSSIFSLLKKFYVFVENFK